MKNKQFICLNGEMFPADEPSLMHNNRAFCYGDALFETIHSSSAKLQFFEEHCLRLHKSMKLLGMEKNSLMETARLHQVISRLLNKNLLYKGARVRLTVFRDSGGLYTPDTGNCSFLAEATSLPYDYYRINERGLKTGIYKGLLKQNDCMANLKTANSLLYVMAGLYARSSGLDECLIMNTDERIAESASSNLFLVSDGVLLTPALSEGCVEGIMRNQVLRLARNEGMETREIHVRESDLISADEFFLTNSISGIRWVVAFGQKRYYSKTARKLSDQLNRGQFGT